MTTIVTDGTVIYADVRISKAEEDDTESWVDSKAKIAKTNPHTFYLSSKEDGKDPIRFVAICGSGSVPFIDYFIKLTRTINDLRTIMDVLNLGAPVQTRACSFLLIGTKGEVVQLRVQARLTSSTYASTLTFGKPKEVMAIGTGSTIIKDLTRSLSTKSLSPLELFKLGSYLDSASSSHYNTCTIVEGAASAVELTHVVSS